MPRRPRDAKQAREFGAEGIGLSPHRAHVLRRRAHPRRARDDSRLRRGRPARGAGQAAAGPASGFHRAVRDHGRPAGHHPPARPAAARVPAASRRGDSRGRRSCSAPTRAWSATGSPSSSEFNPMLGHRGCRLAITYPEITEMQARAIFEAAIEARRKTGKPVSPEVMVPLVGIRKEFDIVRERHRQGCRRGVPGERGDKRRLPGRHHDRVAARRVCAPARSPRRPSFSPSAPTT